MKRLFGALLLLLASSGTCDSQTPPPGAVPSSRVAECRVADFGVALAPWSECRAPISSTLVSRLCGGQSKHATLLTFRQTRDRLSARITDFDELCELDTALVQAQHMCIFSLHPEGSDYIASLMASVALNWHQLGKWDRADQVYRRSFELEGARPWRNFQFFSLPAWSHMKMEAGDLDGAVALARFHTTLARERYDHPDYHNIASGDLRSAAADSLISALQAEALILERANLVNEARAAEQEANQLEALHPPCQEDLCAQWVIGKPIKELPNPCYKLEGLAAPTAAAAP